MYKQAQNLVKEGKFGLINYLILDEKLSLKL